MRNATKRLISLLTALVMACSLIAVPAAADADTKNPPEAGDSGAVNPPEEEEDSLTPDADASSGDTDELSGDTGAAENTGAAGGGPAPAAEENLPTVTLTSAPNIVRKYIYANSEYNDLDRMPELVNDITIEGTLDSTGQTVNLIPEWTAQKSELVCGIKGCVDSWGFNDFVATTFTVQGTNDRVQIRAGAEKAWLNIGVYGLKAEQQTLSTSTMVVKKSTITDLPDSDSN